MFSEYLLPQMSHRTMEEKATNGETLVHIHNINQLLQDVVVNLMYRASFHDRSKLEDPELSTFTEYTPKLKTLKYGSPEYMACLEEMKPALANHYQNNSHHPEHYADGIAGMSLMDLIEMIVDWKASSLRTKDGNMVKSLEFQKERFGIDDQLYQILLNTIKELGYAEE